jgi:bacillithiol biosynthesis deacetylase BshB1
MKVDLLAVGPHPDDVELFVGGTLHKMKVLGYATAIVDLTRGELGTRGSASRRDTESQAAAELLGVDVRDNLKMADGNIENNHAARIQVVKALREYRPTIVFAPHPVARHPDHARASELIRDACFLAGLEKIDTKQGPFRPAAVLYYFDHVFQEIPDIVVDITESYDVKMKGVRAYKSQFYQPGQNGPQTYLSRKEYLEEIEARARFFGSLIGARYGEAFSIRGPVPAADPVAMWS